MVKEQDKKVDISKISELKACMESLSRFSNMSMDVFTPEDAKEFIAVAKEYHQLRADPALVALAGKMEGLYNISPDLKKKIIETYAKTTTAGGVGIDADDVHYAEMNEIYNNKTALADGLENGSVKLDDRIKHPKLGNTTVGEAIKHDTKEIIKEGREKIRKCRQAKETYSKTIIKNASALAQMTPEERKKHLDELRKENPQAAKDLEVAVEYIEKNPKKAVPAKKEDYSKEDILKSKDKKDKTEEELKEHAKKYPQTKRVLEAAKKASRTPEEQKEYADLLIELGATEKELNLLVAKGIQYELEGKGNTKDFLNELEKEGKLENLTAEQRKELETFVEKSVEKGKDIYKEAGGNKEALDKVVGGMTHLVKKEQAKEEGGIIATLRQHSEAVITQTQAEKTTNTQQQQQTQAQSTGRS